MFDILLQFVQRNCQALLKIYNTEREKELGGTMVIIEEKRSADVRYFKDDNLPYEELKEELQEKKSFFETTELEQVKLTDKWIIELPVMSKESLTATPIWYLILDDSHHQSLFIGIPQEVNENTIQYIMVAESHKIMVARRSWKREITTEGQKYLRACYEAYKNPLNYMIFRSNSDFCRVIDKGYDKTFVSSVLDRLDGNDQLRSLLPKIKKIESIGSPILYDSLSLETIRHLWTVMMVKKEFGRMKDWKIREFGGGYGAFCYLLSLVVNWESYELLEINHCAELAKIAMADMELKVDIKDIEEVGTLEPVDLFISEFAFDELNEEGLVKYKHLIEDAKNAVFLMEDEPSLVTMFTEYLTKIFRDVKTVRDPKFSGIILFVCRDKGNLDE